jgi:hypothetical protein
MGFDLGGGAGAFSFDHVGASVTGKIVEVAEQQQTDLDSGEPAFWQSGQPKMMIRVVLQTTLKDSETDDGKRNVYLRGSRKPEAQSSLSAVIQAVLKATGRTELDTGGTLTLTYIGDGEKTKMAYTAPKLYSASYTPPSVNLTGPGAQPPAAPQMAAPPAPTQPTAPAPPGPQNGAQGPQQAVLGWLNGQPVTPDLDAAFRAAGSDPRTQPGWIANPAAG